MKNLILVSVLAWSGLALASADDNVWQCTAVGAKNGVTKSLKGNPSYSQANAAASAVSYCQKSGYTGCSVYSCKKGHY
jgi:hypothetical protein